MATGSWFITIRRNVMDQAASEFHAEMMERRQGMPATLKRGGVAAPIIVVYGSVTHDRYALADGRAQLESEPADFWIRAKWYDFGQGVVEPERGDIIEVQDRIYEVTPRDGERCWKPDNQYRTQFCVRTIRVPATAVVT